MLLGQTLPKMSMDVRSNANEPPIHTIGSAGGQVQFTERYTEIAYGSLPT